ncbi:unnamed protein product [Adineta steineri]|uniref:Tyrosine-protein kinase n=2 Tax=Adineta steineri TaxID=433720 RepID=A0A818VHJ8_9BILA|nr:unnamed protein product [Adineta steineri]CAF3706515.1 unnamed protein product [Adineta steineri]
MDLFDAPFYWGRITRQDAEEILEQTGLKNGLYLIREKFEEAGAYAITLCYLKRFYHYRIDRLLNDNVVLNGSRAQEKFSLTNNDSRLNGQRRSGKVSEQMEFPGPMELINYFQKNADALITTLSIPCQRPFDHNFIQFWCVPLLTSDLYMSKICQEASSTDTEIPIKEKLTYKRYIYERRVLKGLHEGEPWFHSRISRQEAEIRLKNAGGKSGLFLVREKRGDKRSREYYSLSLCYQREYHHYIIQQTANGRLQFASANKSMRINQFGSIVQLIDYYYRHQQDLACALRFPCTRPGGSVRIVPYQSLLGFDTNTDSETSGTDLWSPMSTGSNGPMSVASFFGFDMQNPPLSSDLDNNHDSSSPSKENIFIDEKYLIFGDKLGEGQFGEVYSGKLIGNDENNNGITKPTLQHIAIKQLRHRQDSFVQELYNEGERMLNLDHPYIVKIFGICKHEASISLILELCPYGAMNRWLRLNKTFRMSYILNYMYQVSDGMKYLHEKNIIHRDLALRNILIMSQNVCKISDFGLSRVLEENSYYQIGRNRRLPSMWYPPEVLETSVFHSEIDIWSFGVTIWEATCYGQTPYRQELEAMTNVTFDPISQKLLRFLRDGNRLKRPTNCPDHIYDLMLKCWEYDKHKRPKFDWIRQYLSIYATSQQHTDRF